MKNILCFGDSNTWGASPGAELRRYSREERWTGLLQRRLGPDYYVIEEGLNGRTTVYDDYSPGRRGLDLIVPIIQTHSPLDLIVMMLGTNDTKAGFHAPVREIANGMEALVKAALNPYLYREAVPKMLVVSPVLVGEDVAESWLFGSFDLSSVEKSKRLGDAYRAVAEKYGCGFLDAAAFASAAKGEAVHLTKESHARFAEAAEGKIREMLGAHDGEDCGFEGVRRRANRRKDSATRRHEVSPQ